MGEDVHTYGVDNIFDSIELLVEEDVEEFEM